MRFGKSSERGQVLVLIALGIIGLVGITGLAIDGSIIFADRRQAQNAADTSALAGALAMVKPQYDGGGTLIPWKLVAMNRAESNGYTHNLVTSTVEVYSCDEGGASCPAPYTGDREYVQVIITSHVDTFFARVLGIPQLTNRVQAVALADDDDSGPLFDGAGVVATNPDCPSQGSMIINGSANISILGGGMLSNSNDGCAVKCNLTCQEPVEGEDPKCSLYLCNEEDADGNCIDTGTITTVTDDSTSGGFDIGGQCSTTVTGDLVEGGEEQFPYPLEDPDLDVPAECSGAGGSATPVTWFNPYSGVTENAHQIVPGHYTNFPPKKDIYGNNLESTILMEPGTYCVDTVLKQVGDGSIIYGEGVTLWVTAGNGFQLNGGVVHLVGSSDDYPGFLIIVEPDYYASPVPSCSLTGNANNQFIGAIFAPYCDITVNGSEETPPDGIDSQIIGYNVTINGNADLIINYTSDNNPIISAPPRTGTAK